ncbi:hypothetical protein [Abyssalbus ytuae]|uniref:Uncharacterized protein n=1 Tax=Abyssalbus ytuae TaxID=2926907 RepID=A0A9E7CTJ0_9FLAO|nr:hypothetical protein [Abyssalbus ytuae]UOB16257.1 hypothetical protein MQE35_10965 [Abyssalbus ytuae]
MKEILKKIKHTKLANNCPECYATDTLLLDFYQKCIETPFYKRTTEEITNTIICSKCHSTIYPVKWTEDIERVFDFYMKTIEPEKKSFKLKPLTYILLIIILALGAFVWFNYHEEIKALF